MYKFCLKFFFVLFFFIAIEGCYRYPQLIQPLNKDLQVKKRHSETKKLFKADVESVYEGLLNIVEKEGRKIQAKSSDEHILVISYPFSLSKNLWGGTIKIAIQDMGEHTCVTMHAYEKGELGRTFTTMEMDLIMEDLTKYLGE